MKFVIKPWIQNEKVLVTSAIPTTKVEREALKALKYDLMDVYGYWEPQKLGYPNSCKYLDTLGYTNMVYYGEQFPIECEYDPREPEGYQSYDITAAPRDVEVIVAGYRLLGKHRKVARIIKEAKRRGLNRNEEILRHMDTWGYQVPYRTGMVEE